MKTKNTYFFFFLFPLFLFINNVAFAQWEQIQIPDTIAVGDISFYSTGTHFIATNHGIYASTDANYWNWCGINDYLGVISINDSNTIYAASGTLYRSFDEGITWDTIFNYSQGGLTAVFSSDDQTIFVGTWGGIFRSADSGANWERVLITPYSEVINDIKSNSQGVLFAGSTSFLSGDSPGGLYRSDNNGESWELVGLEYHYISSIEINSFDTIYVGTRGHASSGGGGVFKSIDLIGTLWQNVYDNNLITSMCINEYNTLIIGCSTLDGAQGGIYQSFDNGQTWLDITPSFTGRYFEEVEFNNQNQLYAISYYMYGDLFRTLNPITEIKNKGIVDNNINIFPNPANEELNIKIIEQNDNKVYNVIISGIDGNYLYNHPKIIEGFTIHNTMSIDISELPEGIYFIEIIESNKKRTSKFIKY